VGISLREYARLVFINWWVAVGLLSTLLGIVALFATGGVTLPLWLGLLMALGCLLIAQFVAFHHVRQERDQVPDKSSPLPQTAGGIAVHAETVHIHYNQPPPPQA
jgi:hypothetical protein